MDLSFPKKSYFKQKEVLYILGLDLSDFKQNYAKSLKSFQAETGGKLYLREDILPLYARKGAEVNLPEQKIFIEDHTLKLEALKKRCQGALKFISEIKMSHSESWYNL